MLAGALAMLRKAQLKLQLSRVRGLDADFGAGIEEAFETLVLEGLDHALRSFALIVSNSDTGLQC
jgi:hypothetical protein